MIISKYLCCIIQNKCMTLMFLVISFFCILITFFIFPTNIEFTPFKLVYLKESDKNMNGITLMRIQRYEWVVQFNVFQYSSILVEQLDGTLDIEALFLHDNSVEIDYIRKSVKCFNINPDKDILKTNLIEMLINPFEVIKTEFDVWLIKCKITKTEEVDNQDRQYIGIIDKNAFEKIYNPMNLNNDHILILKAQKPTIYKRYFLKELSFQYL